MPGSIQVSVLGLMDLPSPPPLSSLSLKVVVGKREYRTAGGGELSFPVLSLRENLIVALHDAEGEEILRTEFKTMLLLERGFSENLVPLKNGGSLHMKLQFSLNAEDRKRIREMRDSALKKRRMENHKAMHRRSLSDNRIGGPITKTIAEIITKEMPFDHSELTVTDEYVKTSWESSLHVSEQSFKHSPSQDAHYLTEIKDERRLPPQMVLHQMSGCSKSLVIGNINKLSCSSGASLEKYKYFSPKTNNVQDKVLNSNVKGMINVFESSIYQGVGPYLGQREKFHASGIDTGGSPRRAITGERHTCNLKFPQTMSKSFSSGMLSQISSQGKSNLMESFFLKKKFESQNVTPATNYGILGSKNLKIDKKIGKVDIDMEEIKSTQNISSHADPSSSAPNNSMTIDNVHRTFNNGKSTVLVVYASTSGEIKDSTEVMVEKGSSASPLLLNLKAVEEKENLNFMQKEGIGLDLNATCGTLQARSSSHSVAELRLSGDEHSTAGKNHDNGNRTGDGSANFTGVNRNKEAMDVNKNNNEQQSLRGKFLLLDESSDKLEKVHNPYMQSSLFEVARTRDENTSQNPSNKVAAIDEQSTASMKHNSRNRSGNGTTTSSEEATRKIETVYVNENNKEEQILRDRSLPLKKMFDDSTKVDFPYQQGSSVEVARIVYDEIVSQIPSDEHAVPGNSYKKAEELESGYSLVCPIEILDTWMPRHLCITTGSNLLRDFVESFTVSTETYLAENSSMREADTKQQKNGDAYLQSNESKVLPSSVNSCTENSSRSLKSNGGLIE